MPNDFNYLSRQTLLEIVRTQPLEAPDAAAELARRAAPATEDELALLAWFQAENVKRQAMQDAEPGSWYSMYPDDLEYLRTNNFTSKAVYDRAMTVGEISDSYKELHGFRPRFFNFDSLSQAELDAILAEIRADARREHEFEQAALEAEAAALVPSTEIFNGIPL